MKWRVYSRHLAKEKAENWRKSIANDLLWKPDPKIIEHGLSQEFMDIRKALKEKYEALFAKDSNRKEYAKNRDFGIYMYALFTKQYEMKLSDAANSDVWNYLTFFVIPDLVFNRWDNQINDDRFWANSKRLWPKCLWWMVHLSLQDDLEKTQNVLSESFDISQLVERGGTEGYRIAVFRKIMYYYAQIPKELRGRAVEGKGSSLSRILQRDIVRSSLIEPELYVGGIDEYVKDLFRYFGWFKEEEKNESDK